MIRILKSIALILFLSMSSITMAHHSYAMYDRSVIYVFTGVVESINPDASHLQINFVPLNEARDALVRYAGGARVTWNVEMEGAAASAREGISISTFPRGTVFSVGISPLRNGEPGGVRVGGIFKCAEGSSPEAGNHCNNAAGFTHIGKVPLPKATAAWAL